MTSAVVLGLALRTRIADDSIVPSLLTGAAGLLAAGGAGVVARWWPLRGDLIDGFAGRAAARGEFWCGRPRLPRRRTCSSPVAFGMMTCGIAVVTRRHINIAATIVTLCAVGGLVAAARMWRPIPAQWMGMLTLVGLLFLLTLAPTVALWSARIRPPYFGSVTGRDLFHRSVGLPADAVSPVDEAADEEVSPGHDSARDPDRRRRSTGKQRADGDLRGRRTDAARCGVGHLDAGAQPEWGRHGARRAVRTHLHQPADAHSPTSVRRSRWCAGVPLRYASASSNTSRMSRRHQQARCCGVR